MITFDGLVSSWRYILTVGPSASITLILFMAIVKYRPDLVDMQNRVVPTPLSQLRKSYDFVVIGGGSAGCVLASRLSEISHWNVLLLEAGGDEFFLMDIPALFMAFQRSPWDWSYKTEPSNNYCLAMRNNQCVWPRGKVLGGCSSINAMLYVRGNRKDYDQWRNLGNEGWDYESVLPYFKKMEDMRIQAFANNSFHGYGGPLSVEEFRSFSPLKDIFLKAAEELNVVSVCVCVCVQSEIYLGRFFMSINCSCTKLGILMGNHRLVLLHRMEHYEMDSVVVQIKRI